MDVLAGCGAAALRHDLLEACLSALDLDPKLAIEHASRYSWQATTREFLNNLYPNTVRNQSGNASLPSHGA